MRGMVEEGVEVALKQSRFDVFLYWRKGSDVVLAGLKGSGYTGACLDHPSVLYGEASVWSMSDPLGPGYIDPHSRAPSLFLVAR
jgi:hypothetical protein